MPEARKGAAATQWGEHIYVIGGVNAAGQATGRVDRYHPDTDTWDTMPALDVPRSNAAAVVWNNTLIVIGGHSDGDVILDGVEQFNPTTQEWTQFASLDEPREGLTALVIGETLYIIGGSGAAGQFFDTVQFYEPGDAEWENADDWQLDRARASFASINVMGSVYLMGGFNTFGPLGLVQRYKPDAGLTALASLVPARGGLAAAYVESGLYAIGGLTASNEIVTTVSVYDLDQDQWRPDAPLNTARTQFPAVAYDDVIYVFGGEIESEQVIGSVEAFISGSAPVANDDAFNTEEDVTLTINVVSNDSSPDGSALVITSYTKPAHGEIQEGNLPGNFVYTPDPNYFGLDQFTYTVSNAVGETSSATVSLTVAAVNDAPAFTSAPATAGLVNEMYEYEIRADDVDNTMLIIEADLFPGWLQFTDQNDGTALLMGTPGPTDEGKHQVVLRVSDGTALTEQAFEITVLSGAPGPPQPIAPVNDASGMPATIVLTWSGEGATSWDLQVSTDSLFNDLVYDVAGLIVQQVEIANLERLTTYYWHVRGSNSAGSSAWSTSFQFTTASNVSNEDVLPGYTFSVKPPYPNPFTSQVTVHVELPAHSIQPVYIAVYDIEGRVVDVVHNGHLPPGEHTVSWDGTTSSGVPVASGKYLIQVIQNTFQQSQSVVLVR